MKKSSFYVLTLAIILLFINIVVNFNNVEELKYSATALIRSDGYLESIYFDYQSDQAKYTELIMEFVCLAEENQWDIFYTDLEDNEKHLSDLMDTTSYYYFTNEKEYQKLSISKHLTMSEFNTSTELFTDSPTLLKSKQIKIGSLQQIKKPLKGTLYIRSDQPINITAALSVAQNQPNYIISHDENEYINRFRGNWITEKMRMLSDIWQRESLILFAMFFVYGILILSEIQSRSRELMIKKVHGYSLSKIIGQEFQLFAIRFLVMSLLTFFPLLLLRGIRINFLLLEVFVNYSIFVIITLIFFLLICITSIFYVNSLKPVALINGQKNQNAMLGYAILVKIFILLFLLPTAYTTVDYYKANERVNNCKEQAIERLSNYTTYQSSIASENKMSLFQRLPKDGYYYSFKLLVHSNIPEEYIPLAVNSQWINSLNLTSNGKKITLDSDKMYVLYPEELNEKKVQWVANIIKETSQEQYPGMFQGNVDIISVDTGQIIPAFIDYETTPLHEKYWACVNMEIPDSNQIFFDKGKELPLSIFVGKSNRSFELKILPELWHTDYYVFFLRFFVPTLIFLIIAFIGVIGLFYFNIRLIWDKQIVIKRLHGTPLYQSMVKILVISSAISLIILFSTYNFLQSKPQISFRPIDFSLEYLLWSTAILIVIDIATWLINMHSIKKNQIKILKDM